MSCDVAPYTVAAESTPGPNGTPAAPSPAPTARPVGTMPTSTGVIARAPARNSWCEVSMGRVSGADTLRTRRRGGDLLEIRRERRSQLVEPEVVRELEHVPLAVA